MIINKTIESSKNKFVYIYFLNNSNLCVCHSLICDFLINFLYKCCTYYALILTAISFDSIFSFIVNKGRNFNIRQNKIDIIIGFGQYGQTLTPRIKPNIVSIDINSFLLGYNRLINSTLWEIILALL